MLMPPQPNPCLWRLLIPPHSTSIGERRSNSLPIPSPSMPCNPSAAHPFHRGPLRALRRTALPHDRPLSRRRARRARPQPAFVLLGQNLQALHAFFVLVSVVLLPARAELPACLLSRQPAPPGAPPC